MNRIQRARTAPGCYLPYVVGIISVLLCLWCSIQSLGFGLSQLYAARAFENNDLSFADRAVQLARSDPEAYLVRAAVLAKQKRFTEATIDLEHALDLSPRDVELWIQLGDGRAQLLDTKGALTAYSEATRLAPGYAHPHWLLGNCLLKAGRLEEAFRELRLACTIMPALFVKNIELAWQSYNGEPHTVEEALQPKTVHERIALALFFSEHGRADEAVSLFRDAGRLPADERQLLLRELLDANRFAEAYQVWAAGKAKMDLTSGVPSISNGGFEGEIVLDDPGFDWRFQQNDRTVGANVDTLDPRDGLQSLRLDLRGDSDPSTPLVYQLVLVKPKSHYCLRFFARTLDLITAGLPRVAVVEAKGNAAESLKRHSVTEWSSPIRADKSWQEYSVAFKTSEDTQAVFVIITREQCSTSPCPAFGHLWLDDFSIEKLS